MGNFRKASHNIPDDGQVVLNLGSIRSEVDAWVAQQEPGIHLGTALRELIALGLSLTPPESAIHLARARAYYETRSYVLKRMFQGFGEIQDEIESTGVLMNDEGTDYV